MCTSVYSEWNTIDFSDCYFPYCINDYALLIPVWTTDTCNANIHSVAYRCEKELQQNPRVARGDRVTQINTYNLYLFKLLDILLELISEGIILPESE